MGSASDEEAVQPTINTLESLGIDYEVRVMSAHRTPDAAGRYAREARSRGIKVLIAAAGGAAQMHRDPGLQIGADTVRQVADAIVLDEAGLAPGALVAGWWRGRRFGLAGSFHDAFPIASLGRST